MESRLVDGVPPLPEDAAIAALFRPAADPAEGGGIALNLAILGPDGRIYRTARAWDLGAYQRVTDGLRRLGLVSQARQHRALGLSFEEVFSRPPADDAKP